MTSKALLGIAAIAMVCMASTADAAKRAKPAAAAASAQVVAATPGPVQDCSAFYSDYARRGFTWGSGPGLGLGFGVFEGALPRYIPNEFPNWYGECVNWGHYSASGTAARPGLGGIR